MYNAYNSTLYMMNSNGEQVKLGDDFYGDIEIDTWSPDEIPLIIGSAKSALSVSYEMSIRNINWISGLIDNQFTPTKNFDIECNTPIFVQARWHKKKRINKKWLKRYGMKPDTVKMKAEAHTLNYNTETGECEFETDKLKYIWRPDQKRKNLKIEM